MMCHTYYVCLTKVNSEIDQQQVIYRTYEAEKSINS